MPQLLQGRYACLPSSRHTISKPTEHEKYVESRKQGFKARINLRRGIGLFERRGLDHPFDTQVRNHPLLTISPARAKSARWKSGTRPSWASSSSKSSPTQARCAGKLTKSQHALNSWHIRLGASDTSERPSKLRLLDDQTLVLLSPFTLLVTLFDLALGRQSKFSSIYSSSSCVFFSFIQVQSLILLNHKHSQPFIVFIVILFHSLSFLNLL